MADTMATQREREIDMFIYKISQNQNTDYDTYDSAVVIAKDIEEARNMNPSTGEPMNYKDWDYTYGDWCNAPEHVTVECIGAANELYQGSRVVCASFNAG